MRVPLGNTEISVLEVYLTTEMVIHFYTSSRSYFFHLETLGEKEQRKYLQHLIIRSRLEQADYSHP